MWASRFRGSCRDNWWPNAARLWHSQKMGNKPRKLLRFSSSLGKEWRCSYSLYTEKRLIALARFYKHRPYKEFRLISHKSTGRHVFAEPQCKTRQVVEFINCVNEFHVCYAFHSAFAKPYSMPSGVHIYFSAGLPLIFLTSYMLWDYLSVWPGAKTPISLKETVVAPAG